MPRKRREGRGRTAWTEAHLAHMRTGNPWDSGLLEEPFGSSADDHSFDEAFARDCWDDIGENILAECEPFSRPWGFWRFDAPEPRRRINGVHPFDNPERKAVIKAALLKWPGHVLYVEASKLKHGIPAHLITDDDVAARYESEKEYLIRLDLLTDRERALLEQSN